MALNERRSKIVRRDERQRLRTTKYLDPRRVGLPPARLLARHERGIIRDYHRLPRHVNDFDRATDHAPVLASDILAFAIHLVPLLVFLLTGFSATTAVQILISSLISACLDVSVTSKSRHVKLEWSYLAVLITNPSASLHCLATHLPGINNIGNTHAHVSKDGKELVVPIDRSRVIPGLPPLSTCDADYVTVFKGGQPIAIPIDRSPLTVYSAREERARKREDKKYSPLPESVTDSVHDSLLDDGDDDNWQSDEVSTSRKKRKATKQKAPKTAKKRKSVVQSDNSEQLESYERPLEKWTALGLADIPITRDESTTLLNRFVDWVEIYGLKSKPTKKNETKYTMSPESAEYVWDLPLYDPEHRQWEVVEDKVELYDHELLSGLAANKKDPSAPLLPLFTFPRSERPALACPTCIRKGTQVAFGCDAEDGQACTRCKKAGDATQCARELASHIAIESSPTLAGHNLLQEQVCSDRRLIIELGKIAVDIMNRLPADLNVSQWSGVSASVTYRVFGCQACPTKTFVDIVSLYRWNEQHYPSLDLQGLPDSRRWLRWQLTRLTDNVWTHLYARPTIYKLSTTQLEAYLGAPSGIWLTAATTGKGSLVYIESEAVDLEKTRDLSSLQEFPFLPVFPDESPLTENAKLVEGAKVLKHSAKAMVGLVGAPRAVNLSFEQISTTYLNKRREDKPQFGPYKGCPLWRKPVPMFTSIPPPTRLQLGSTVIDDLVTAKVPDQTLRVYTKITDSVCLAYIMQQTLEALVRGEDLLKCFSLAPITAQLLERGLITREEVLSNYCTCPDEDTSASTDHICTACFATRRCSSMRIAEDGSLQCPRCLAQDFVVFNSPIVWRGIEGSTRAAFSRDAKYHTPPYRIEDLFASILRYKPSATTQSDSWLDGYSNRIMSIAEAQWPTHMRTWTSLHPFAPSIEKAHRRWLRPDGSISLHDPANTLLTLLSVNNFKGVSPLAILPFAKRCRELKTKAHGTIQRGYQAELQGDWKLMNRVADHISIIQKFCGNNKSRVAKGQDVDRLKADIKSERTGIWHGRLPNTSNTAGYRQLFSKVQNGAQFAMGDKLVWDWEVMLDCIAQMEKDVGVNGMNKYKLTIPRLGKNKDIPWLFREDTCPADVDEAYIFNEYSARLKRMDDVCDADHETIESPATMFLEHAVQWLETGGKCHIFGFVMTNWTGHPMVYSFGRGITQLMPDGTRRNIRPGERMCTGWKTLLPRNVHKDYDLTRRTLVIESWKANLLRFKFPGGQALIPLLEQAIDGLLPQCEWYDPIRSVDHYLHIPYPMNYKNRAEWWAEMRAFDPTAVDSNVDEMLAEEDADERTDRNDVFDEEVEFHLQALAETEAIKAGEIESATTDADPGE